MVSGHSNKCDDLEHIQNCIKAGAFVILSRAAASALKYGVAPEHRISVINAGRIIENYPERSRCLILGTTPDGLPFHVVVECTGNDWITIVSNYVPDARYWEGDWATRRPGKPHFDD